MIFSWLILIVEGLFCYLFKSQIPENDDAICFSVIAINVIAVIGEILSRKDDKHRKFLLCIALAFRLFLLFWDLKCQNIYVLPNSGLDSEMYAAAAKTGLLIGDWDRGGMYAKYIAFWYRFFGIERPIAQYTNILLALSIIDFVVETMKYLKIKQADQNLIVLMLSILPNFALMNCILLRETIMMFTTAVSVSWFMKWLNENRFVFLAGSVIICCIGALFHSGAIAPMLGGAFVFVLYDRDVKHIKFNRNSIFSIIIVITAFFVLQNTVGDTIFSKFQGKESADDLISTAESYNAGGSAYEAGFEINNSVLSLIVNTPIRMFYFVASPVPWNWRGSGDIIAFLFSAMVYLYVYYYAIKELKRGNNTNKTLVIVLLILTLSTALIFAWGVSNAGSALRHREKFISIYLLLLAVARSGHTEIVEDSLKTTKIGSIS